MTPIDPLERELQSIQPPPMPASVRLEIEQGLRRANQPATSYFVRCFSWRIGAVGIAAAACAAILFFTIHVGRRKTVVSHETLPLPRVTTGMKLDPPITLATYTQAAGESSLAVNRLLDADASRSAGFSSEVFRAHSQSFDDLNQ